MNDSNKTGNKTTPNDSNLSNKISIVIMVVIALSVIGYFGYQYLTQQLKLNNAKLSDDFFYKAINCENNDCKLDNYAKAIEINPDNKFAYIGRYIVYDTLSDKKKMDFEERNIRRTQMSIDEFDNFFEKAIALNPNNSDLHLMGSFPASRFSNYTNLQKAIKLNPKNAIAYYYVGKDRSNKSEYNIDYLEKSIELNPTHSDSYKLLSVNYRFLKKLDKAIENQTTYIELESAKTSLLNMIQLYETRLDLYLENKQLDKALDDLNKIISIYKSLDTYKTKDLPYWVYQTRGIINFQNEKYDESLKDLSKSIELNKIQNESFFYRGKVYLKVNKFEQTIEDLTKVIENFYGNDETLIDLYENRAIAYKNLGKNDLKDEDLLKVKKLKEKSQNESV